MKISNSKKELARIISENGGWRGGDFSAQDQNASVTFFMTKPWRNLSVWESDEFECVDGFLVCPGALPNWHQTILSRAEYFHLYPAPDADGWIEWNGGECPVDDCEIVQVKYRDDDGSGMDAIVACELYWEHHGKDCDIISYRPHKPEQAKKEFCESVMRSIPEPETKPTIEQLATDYRNAKDCAERKQREADDSKADAEVKLKALVLAGEALGLIVSPITAKQEPELEITDWRDLLVGDEISVQHMKNVYSKSEVLVVGNSEVSIRNHAGVRKAVNLDDVDWKFIRRP